MKFQISTLFLMLFLSAAPRAAMSAEPEAPAAKESPTFASSQKEIEQRLESSLQELSTLRDQIAEEKIPLSREVANLEEQVTALRRERASLLKSRETHTVDLSTLRKRVQALEEQEDFLNSRLNEFIHDFEGRLNISENSQYEALTNAATLSEQDANLDLVAKRGAQLALVQAAIERLEKQLGGYTFVGEALSPEGVLTKGTFIAIGPTVFYASEDGAVVGIVESQLNTADPVIVTLPDQFRDGLVQLAQGGAGSLPIDPTMDKALKSEKAGKSVAQFFEDGGVVGVVICLLGLGAFGLTGFKVREIGRFSVASHEVVERVLGELSVGNAAGAMKLAREVPGVSGEMLVVGVENANEKPGVLEEVLFEKVLTARPQLERFLPFLAITAGAAPLLGLLGTVTGMIKTFELITIFGTGDAKNLSSGISEALVTTAMGLVVAIPVLIVHGIVSRMAKRKLGLLEQISVAFVNGVVAIRNRAERHE